MHIRKALPGVMILVAALTTVGMPVASASAAPTTASGTVTTRPAKGGGTITTEHLPGGSITTYSSPTGVDKQAWLANQGVAVPQANSSQGSGSIQPNVVPYSVCGVGIHNYHTFSPDEANRNYEAAGLTNGAFVASGSSRGNASCGWEDYLDFTSSNGTACWLGTSPAFYTTQIANTLKWWVSGIAISVSIPPSVGFGSLGSGIEYAPGAVATPGGYCATTNAYTTIHEAGAAINNAYYSVSSTLWIGTSSYLVSATSAW